MPTYAKRYIFVVLLVVVVLGSVWSWEIMKANSFKPQIVLGLLATGAIIVGLFVFVWTTFRLTDDTPPGRTHETEGAREAENDMPFVAGTKTDDHEARSGGARAI